MISQQAHPHFDPGWSELTSHTPTPHTLFNPDISLSLQSGSITQSGFMMEGGGSSGGGVDPGLSASDHAHTQTHTWKTAGKCTCARKVTSHRANEFFNTAFLFALLLFMNITALEYWY